MDLSLVFSVLGKAMKDHPAIASYCAMRGAASGSVGVIDNITDAVNFFRDDDNQIKGLGSEIASSIDSASGVDPTKFSDEEEFACLGGDLIGSTASSAAVPFAALKGVKYAKKFQRAAELIERTHAAEIAKGAAIVNAGASVVITGGVIVEMASPAKKESDLKPR